MLNKYITSSEGQIFLILEGTVTTVGDSASRRTRVTMADATLTKFPTCPTNYMRDPIAGPEAGHMSYFC